MSVRGKGEEGRKRKREGRGREKKELHSRFRSISKSSYFVFQNWLVMMPVGLRYFRQPSACI